MQYLPLFLLFLAVLIAAWFYLQRAKTRDTGKTAMTTSPPPSSVDDPASAAAAERAE